MRSLKLVLLSAGILLLTAPAWADQLPGTDPRVIIGSGMGSQPEGFTFLFGSPSGCSPATNPNCPPPQLPSPCTVGTLSVPDCVFQNSTTTTFTGLTFDVDAAPPVGSTVGCGIAIGGPFLACTIGPDSDGFVATFTECSAGGQCGSGVLPGGDFSIEVEGWNPDTDFGVGANGMTPPDSGATPEPGTVMLVLTGISALMLPLRTIRPRCLN